MAYEHLIFDHIQQTASNLIIQRTSFTTGLTQTGLYSYRSRLEA